jgi:hypothetical protein
VIYTADTRVKFLSPAGYSPIGRTIKWNLPQGDQPGEWMRLYKTKPRLCEFGWHFTTLGRCFEHITERCFLFEPAGLVVESKWGDKSAAQGGRLLAEVEPWNNLNIRLMCWEIVDETYRMVRDELARREMRELSPLIGESLAQVKRMLNHPEFFARPIVVDAGLALAQLTRLMYPSDMSGELDCPISTVGGKKVSSSLAEAIRGLLAITCTSAVRVVVAHCAYARRRLYDRFPPSDYTKFGSVTANDVLAPKLLKCLNQPAVYCGYKAPVLES